MTRLINRFGGIKSVLPFIIGGAFLLTLPLYIGQYYMHIFIVLFLNIVFALSYRIFFIAGMGSFGHAAFYAIGAYVSAVLTTRLGIPFPASFLAAGAIAGIIGAGISFITRRAKGIYFFMITFALFQIVLTIIRQWTDVTGGVSGIGNIPPVTGCESMTSFFYMGLLFVGVSVFIMYLIDTSRFGRELMAIGDADDLAEVIGINVSGYKMIAFAIGAIFAGFAGSFLAHYTGYISPHSFPMWLNLNVILFVVVGGERKLWGPITGAVLLTFIAELLRGAEHLQAIIYGGILIAVILTMPSGIVGLVDNWRAKRGKKSIEAADRERSKLLTRFFGGR